MVPRDTLDFVETRRKMSRVANLRPIASNISVAQDMKKKVSDLCALSAAEGLD